MMAGNTNLNTIEDYITRAHYFPNKYTDPYQYKIINGNPVETITVTNQACECDACKSKTPPFTGYY